MRALAIIGAGLLALALVLAWLKMTWYVLGALVLVGVIDIFLVIMKADTISQWLHRQFPKVWDMVILIGLLVCTWIFFGGPTSVVPVLIGVIMGHIFWDG